MSVDVHSTVEPPFVVAPVRVAAVRRLSPNFVRITLAGDALADFGNVGATFDQRVKLIFPPESGVLPALADGPDWYQNWLAVPDDRRGTMRTYSIREIRVDDDGTTVIDIDFVLHLTPGKTGPASSWAAAAMIGDQIAVIGPRRGRFDGGGVEYRPGRVGQVLLAGDETATPAIARILADAPADLRGVAYLEIPDAADAQDLDAPDGVEVHWLPRRGAAPGERLLPAVLERLGDATATGRDDAVAAPEDALVWETPTFSGTGEQIAGEQIAGERIDETASPTEERYYWIAGESRVVTTLRRHLVKDHRIPRAQVAFMGYWREGVAMKG